MSTLKNLWDGLISAVGIIKTIAIIILIVIVVGFLLSLIGEKKKLKQLQNHVIELEATNSELIKKVNQREREIQRLAIMNSEYQDSLYSLNMILEVLKKDYAELESEFAEQINDLTSIPPDSSYSFLQEVYDYSGELQYPFNGQQVKGIHKTWVEKGSLEKMNYNLQDQVTGYKNANNIQEKIIRNQYDQIIEYSENERDLKEIIDNDRSIINKQEDHINREQSRKNLYKTLSIISTTVAVVLLII